MHVHGHHLWSETRYVKELHDAGFLDAKVKDMTLWYCMMCQREMDTVRRSRPLHGEFLRKYSNNGFPTIQEIYRDKIEMSLRGDRSYILLKATKDNQDYSVNRQQVVDTVLNLSIEGFINGGSVSTRIDHNRFLVTPSVVNDRDFDASKIVLCDRSGNPVLSEECDPGLETMMHCFIYQKRSDVGAIVHFQSVYANGTYHRFYSILSCCTLSNNLLIRRE